MAASSNAPLRPLGQRGDQQRGPAGVGGGVRVRHVLRQQAPGGLCGQPRRRERSPRAGCPHAGISFTIRGAPLCCVQAMVSPPARHGATLSGCPSISVASANTLIVGQVRRLAAECSARVRRGSRRRSPPTRSPRPRACGMRLRQRSRMPAPAAATPIRSKVARIVLDDEVPLAVSSSPPPRRDPTDDLGTPPRVGERGLDLVVQAQRQPQGVEPGSEIGRRRRHADVTIVIR